MKGSLRLGTFFGIGVHVHWTFSLLLGFVAWRAWQAGADAAGIGVSVVFVLAIFACVVMHEYGHALTARRYGIGTKDITLLPIGGVARLERMPEEPRQELVVAVMGPMVNVVIAAVIFGVMLGTGTFPKGSEIQEMGRQGVESMGALDARMFFLNLAGVNVFLVLFNMIPAFPMDGGRVLRALLSMAMDPVRATRAAANVGKVLAVGFALLGLWGNPFLIFIGIFVWISAEAEARQREQGSALRGTLVSDAMVRRFVALDEDDSLQWAIERLLEGAQTDFPVMKTEMVNGERVASGPRGGVVGVLTRHDLLHAIARHVDMHASGGVGTLTRKVPVVRTGARLEPAVRSMQEAGSTVAPVVDETGRLVGLLTMENLAEFVMVRQTMGPGGGGGVGAGRALH